MNQSEYPSSGFSLCCPLVALFFLDDSVLSFELDFVPSHPISTRQFQSQSKVVVVVLLVRPSINPPFQFILTGTAAAAKSKALIERRILLLFYGKVAIAIIYSVVVVVAVVVVARETNRQRL